MAYGTLSSATGRLSRMIEGMTSITTTDTVAAYTTVAHDLYRDVHKAIRTMLFDTVAAAGRLDPSDRVARVAHANRVRDLVRFLAFHAEHEDSVLDEPIRRVLPEQADAIACDHLALEQQMADLVALADLVFDCERTDARAAVHTLYLDLASFVSAYLAHQDVEERVVMPALEASCGVPGLLELHARILAEISPEDMGWSLSVMIPAMNIDDRAEMLGGMRAEAPTEVFAGVWGLVTTVLPADDVAALAARLDIAPAPV
jgi:Hemerythrin HHE cation binding domain